MSIHKFKLLLVVLLLQLTCLLPAQSDLLTAAGARPNNAQAKEQGACLTPSSSVPALSFQAETGTRAIMSEQS